MTRYVEPEPTQRFGVGPLDGTASAAPEATATVASAVPASESGAASSVAGEGAAAEPPVAEMKEPSPPADPGPKDPGSNDAPATLDGGEPRRPKVSPLWAKLCVILGAFVMAASGLVAMGPRVLISYATRDIPRVDALPEPPQTIDGPINILMLGMDARPESAGSNGSRADTIIIAHIPATHDAIYMVSIPRDLEVAIPPFAETGYVGESAQKINAAFFFGAKQAGGETSAWDRPADLSPAGRGRGGALTAMAIDQLVPGGLKFNAMVVINFDGFLRILEVIDGVEMCVDQDTYSTHYYPDGTRPRRGDLPVGEGKFYPAGCYHMQAWEALDFARQRYSLSDGDYGRQRHQQQLIKAIIEKMMSRGVLTDPGKLLDLQSAAGDLLTLDLGPVAIDEWLFTLSHLRPDDMIMIKTNGGRFYSAGAVIQGNQTLTEESEQLLAALSTDTVGDFIAQHPDWVSEG